MSYETALSVEEQVKKAVLGKDEVIHQIMMAILAKGHILMEDIPGVGKTTMALAFSKAMNLCQHRVQFTTDVLPSDVVGFTMYNSATNTFEFREGAVLCNLFLADEINRTSSKTQSALLEAMEEGQVTVDGTTHLIPRPFIVIATQNPVGSAGTQMLPESQLDRFMVKLSMGYPDAASEASILAHRQGSNPLCEVTQVVDGEELLTLQQEANDVFVSDAIYDYIANLASFSRKISFCTLGISPRGTLAVAAMTRAHAYLSGRDYAIPEDVAAIWRVTTDHRLILSPKARVNHITLDKVQNSILKSVPIPKAEKH